MTDTRDRVSVPAALVGAGDPIEGNPFPTEDARYRVWREATLTAEEELCRLNSEFAKESPTGREGFAVWMREKMHSAAADFARWTLDLCTGKFNIWAKRNIQVVWSDDGVRQYDQWLFNYAQAWLNSVQEAGYVSHGTVLELRLRLIERLEWWKGEVRRYRAAQQAHSVSTAKQGAPRKSRDGKRGREWYFSTPDVVRRRQIVLRNPTFRSKQLSKIFDANRIPVPEGWDKEFPAETWVDAHRNAKGRARIQRIISTDKKGK